MYCYRIRVGKKFLRWIINLKKFITHLAVNHGICIKSFLTARNGTTWTNQGFKTNPNLYLRGKAIREKNRSLSTRQYYIVIGNWKKSLKNFFSFFSKLDQVLAYDYEPTTMDVIYARIVTSGVYEIEFFFKSFTIR